MQQGRAATKVSRARHTSGLSGPPQVDCTIRLERWSVDPGRFPIPQGHRAGCRRATALTPPKLGDFNGVQNGVTNGLLFPASPDFSPDRQTRYVTNLELDLMKIGITQSVDSQWGAESLAMLCCFTSTGWSVDPGRFPIPQGHRATIPPLE